MTLYEVGTTNQLDPGDRISARVGDVELYVFNIDGEYHALSNKCPHEGGPLCAGIVTGTTEAATGSDQPAGYVWTADGEIVRCPWHGWEFWIKTGEMVADHHLRAKTYPVEINDGTIYVDL